MQLVEVINEREWGWVTAEWSLTREWAGEGNSSSGDGGECGVQGATIAEDLGTQTGYPNNMARVSCQKPLPGN